MENELVKKEPSVPGIGVSGMVMCPYGFQKSPCLKSGCEMWIELNQSGIQVGRCSFAWQTILLIELRQSIEKLGVTHATIEKGDSSTG